MGGLWFESTEVNTDSVIKSLEDVFTLYRMMIRIIPNTPSTSVVPLALCYMVAYTTWNGLHKSPQSAVYFYVYISVAGTLAD